MMWKLVLLMVAMATAENVHFQDCGSTSGNIKYVDISDCAQLPCSLKQGTNITVQVEFLSKTSTSTVAVVVHGIIADVPIPFPVSEANGCKSGINCPITKGASNLYKTDLFVSTLYPKLKLLVKWELKDEKTDDLVCFVIPVQIV